MSGSNPEEDRELLAAAQLLLKNVRRRREELDRRERDLLEEVASYKVRLNASKPQTARESTRGDLLPLGPFPDDDLEEAEAGEQYGAIGDAVKEIVSGANGIDMAGIAAKLEERRVTIRAKNYLSAARTAVRRLRNDGDVRARKGRYFPKRQEAQSQD
jgi:hypothetical protein